MSGIAARAMMILAERCLGKTRRQWALAMRVEFEVASAEGKPLQFAMGCLIAAFRDMPAHREGRLVLADHALALGLLVPMAAIQFFYAGGALYLGNTQNPYLGGAQVAAAPYLLILWLIVGAAHLRLAWVLLEQDWPRVFSSGAVIVAGTATLVIYMGVLFLNDLRLGQNIAAIAVELAMLSAAARWHGSNMFALADEFA